MRTSATADYTAVTAPTQFIQAKNDVRFAYPDAAHGSFYQYHDDFVFETNRFLDA